MILSEVHKLLKLHSAILVITNRSSHLFMAEINLTDILLRLTNLPTTACCPVSFERQDRSVWEIWEHILWNLLAMVAIYGGFTHTHTHTHTIQISSRWMCRYCWNIPKMYSGCLCKLHNLLLGGGEKADSTLTNNYFKYLPPLVYNTHIHTRTHVVHNYVPRIHLTSNKEGCLYLWIGKLKVNKILGIKVSTKDTHVRLLHKYMPGDVENSLLNYEFMNTVIPIPRSRH